MNIQEVCKKNFVSQKLFASLVAAMIIGAVVSLAYLTYLVFFDVRVPPITVMYSHPTAIANLASSRNEIIEMPEVHAGDTFYTYREYCITAKYTALRIERWLVPADHHQFPVPLALLPARMGTAVGCAKRSFSNRVPDETPAGDYTFEANWLYIIHGNAIATYTWEWPVVHVRIAAAPITQHENLP